MVKKQQIPRHALQNLLAVSLDTTASVLLRLAENLCVFPS